MERNLQGLDLRKETLGGANLSGANLKRANLAGANLTGANLLGTDLTGAFASTETIWPTGFLPFLAGVVTWVDPPPPTS